MSGACNRRPLETPSKISADLIPPAAIGRGINLTITSTWTSRTALHYQLSRNQQRRHQFNSGCLLVGEENHAVTEGDTISFDVDVENERGDCIIPFPFTVSTEPSTGTALLETGDQASKSQRFPACTASKTFEFQTVATPGTQADQTITFDIERATNTDSRISLEGQSSVHQYTVTVQNNGN